MRLFRPGIREMVRLLLSAAGLAVMAVAVCAQGVAQPGQGETAGQPTLAGSAAVLNAYRVAVESAETTVRNLAAQFPPESGTRISYDARTAQLLVFAPPAVQQQVAAKLGVRGQAPAAPGPTPAQTPQKARGPKVVPLQRLSPQDFELTLAKVFGRPLPVNVERGGQWARYTLATRGGSVSLIVDRAAKQVALEGPVKLADAWGRVIEALDRQAGQPGEDTHIVPLTTSRRADVAKALQVFGRGSLVGSPRPPVKLVASGTDSAALPLKQDSAAGRLIGMIFQQRGEEAEGETQAGSAPPQDAQHSPPDEAQQAMPPNEEQGEPAGVEGGSGLIGPVQIEYLEELDTLVIRGHPADVEKVMQIINQIEQLSGETQPQIDIYRLRHVSSQAISTLVQQLYDQVLAPRQGRVNITPLVKPNSLLLVGRPEAVSGVIDLVKRLDIPVGPAAMFQVFGLQHTSAAAAKQTIDGFFLARATGLGGQPTVVADFRTNSIIVQGSPNDLQEVQALLRKIDIATTPAVNELRVFPLRNSAAEELAQTLQDAISTEQPGAQQPQQQGFQFPGQNQQQQQQQPSFQQQNQQNRPGQGLQPRSTALRFVTVDGELKQGLRSGILADVRITADPQKNTLLVSAPAESMELIAALIRQLDEMPAAQVQIKVFTVVNGDVATLTTMLQNLFGQSTNPQGQSGLGGFAQQVGQGEGGTLIPLRFSYDQRTNSIIASGSTSELLVVEAVLARLDDIDVRTRESTVYRLKNVPSLDVANAITQYLSTERQLQQQLQPQGTLNPFEQIEREVVVVPEPVSNSLIISATPRFYREIIKLIEDIDRRPPMVMIQVLIAEVTLNNTDEFGVEIGLQDSVLFDRSLVGVPDFITRTVTTNRQVNGTAISTQTQEIVGASNDPGYDFNNAANPVIPNSASDRALQRSGHVGGQGLSQFAMGRINQELGYGGFVLSASSEGVSALLRALAECRRLDVLSRPQVMTLDNQPAYVQVGQRVPRVNATSITQTGQTNSVILDNIGIILGVTPRISPDGLVVMQIDATKSELGPEAEGIPISINETGQVIRSPIYNTTVASTTVSAVDAQTVVLGGLITQRKDQRHRRVPYLSNLPVVGYLFRYDYTAQRRTELLIIMTPHIVRNQDDADRIKQMEAARMSWCLGDVIKLDGDRGLRQRTDEFADDETTVIYPNVDAMPTPAAPPPHEELGPPPQPATPAPGGPVLQQSKTDDPEKLGHR
ncbi:MAG: hypothetical protein IT427_14965 [Pirellulales bacterium]|nr:hypothetical protein [Pirellulales bacterium]